jgi:ATP-dependent Clp protease adaptor protein ClpS
MSDMPRFNVMLLNDDKTPMEFVVRVLERFFDMSTVEATAHMYRVHNKGAAICGTYRREEAERKVSDVLAFAGEHKHPLKCVLEQAG